MHPSLQHNMAAISMAWKYGQGSLICDFTVPQEAYTTGGRAGQGRAGQGRAGLGRAGGRRQGGAGVIGPFKDSSRNTIWWPKQPLQ